MTTKFRRQQAAGKPVRESREPAIGLFVMILLVFWVLVFGLVFFITTTSPR